MGISSPAVVLSTTVVPVSIAFGNFLVSLNLFYVYFCTSLPLKGQPKYGGMGGGRTNLLLALVI